MDKAGDILYVSYCQQIPWKEGIDPTHMLRATKPNIVYSSVPQGSIGVQNLLQTHLATFLHYNETETVVKFYSAHACSWKYPLAHQMCIPKLRRTDKSFLFM